MKRIGLTQRVEIIEPGKERRDCLDQKWVSLLSACGLLSIPLCNGVENIEFYLDTLSLDGLILTGGNDLVAYGDSGTAPERDKFEFAAINYFSKKGLPVLGVCRGMQVLNVWNGGKLAHIDDHAGSRHKVRILEPGYIYESGTIEVNSFHNFGITEQNLSESLTAIAISDDGLIEAIVKKTKPQIGVMWHPEREKPIDPRDIHMIENYFSITSNKD